MVVKTNKGYVAYSDDRRRLGGPFETRTEADAVVTKVSQPVVEGGPYGGKENK